MSKESVSKAELRQILLARRRQMSLHERQIAAVQVAALLIASDIFQSSQYIAAYYPFNHEFDCLPIIQAIWQVGKKCYLPIVSTEKRSLTFVLYEEDTVLRPNRYNIPEPIEQHAIALNTLDLVLLPLLGFDKEGNRLGMGAGFYDATFQQAKKPFLLGLGYEAQRVSFIPHDSWDVKLQGVVTEERMVLF